MRGVKSTRDVVRLIISALREDIGSGDISSSVIPDGTEGRGYIVANEPLVLAGIEIARMVFARLNKKIRFVALKRDGEEVKKGECVAEVYGDARAIMAGERTAINFLQRLSGIATHTRKFVNKIKNYNAVLLDTRKTTPGLRLLEKYATRIGGARNHRLGLYDGLMLKSNHIKCAGGMKNALTILTKKFPRRLNKAMIEVRNFVELEEAIKSGVKYILLDNFSIKDLKRAVRFTGGRAVLEATGGVNLNNIQKIAATGVDFISAGALTHSARWVNISLKISE
jgi:nicotinate-nucleotide pyrophosphorylase (carboxylating)